MFSVYSGISVESDSVIECKMQNMLMIDIMLFFPLYMSFIVSGISSVV